MTMEHTIEREELMRKYVLGYLREEPDWT